LPGFDPAAGTDWLTPCSTSTDSRPQTPSFFQRNQYRWPRELTITASQPLDRDPTRIYCTSNAENFQLTPVSQKRRNLLAVNSARWLSYRQVHPRTVPTSTREVLRSRPVGQIYEPSHLHCFTTRVTLHTTPTISIKSLTFTTYYSPSSTTPHPLSGYFLDFPKLAAFLGKLLDEPHLAQPSTPLPCLHSPWRYKRWSSRPLPSCFSQLDI
jgi:hypothetical protein